MPRAGSVAVRPVRCRPGVGSAGRVVPRASGRGFLVTVPTPWIQSLLTTRMVATGFASGLTSGSRRQSVPIVSDRPAGSSVSENWTKSRQSGLRVFAPFVRVVGPPLRGGPPSTVDGMVLAARWMVAPSTTDRPARRGVERAGPVLSIVCEVLSVSRSRSGQPLASRGSWSAGCRRSLTRDPP
jgi:hypothetical protein